MGVGALSGAGDDVVGRGLDQRVLGWRRVLALPANSDQKHGTACGVKALNFFPGQQNCLLTLDAGVQLPHAFSLTQAWCA